MTEFSTQVCWVAKLHLHSRGLEYVLVTKAKPPFNIFSGKYLKSKWLELETYLLVPWLLSLRPEISIGTNCVMTDSFLPGTPKEVQAAPLPEAGLGTDPFQKRYSKHLSDGWGDGSAVKCTGRPSRRSGFNPKHPQGSSQLCVTPLPEDHPHTDTHTGKTPIP